MSPAGAERFDCRVAFAEELTALARRDGRVVAVCNDSVGSSNLVQFASEFPGRLVNVGIAEQDMVGVAAGLANGGLVPFVCGAAPFLTGRAMEQIKVDVAYSGAHVVLCGMSPGMAYGQLGPTHHSVEDLPWMRAIAGLSVLAPGDPADTRAALRWAFESEGPSYLRVPRTKLPALPDGGAGVGRARELRGGDQVTLMGLGPMGSVVLEASELLERQGVSARALFFNAVRPLDVEAIGSAARETGRLLTVEEGTLAGGFGSAVAEWCGEHLPVPVRRLGLPEQFAPTGSAEFLLAHFGLTAEGVARAAGEWVLPARAGRALASLEQAGSGEESRETAR